MKRIQEEQKLHSFKKIEKAIGNAEKALQTQKEPPGPPDAVIHQAKHELTMAWNHHLSKRI